MKCSAKAFDGDRGTKEGKEKTGGHPRRRRPPHNRWKSYAVTDGAALRFRELYPDQLVGDGRMSSFDIEANSWRLRKLWIKRGRFFGHTRQGDKIVACRPSGSRREVFLLVRPGEEVSGIITVLTDREACQQVRLTRRKRHR